MARETYVYREGLGVIPKSEASPLETRKPSHFVISDEIHGGVQSMISGRYHDSKSALRREYREAGVTEVGNEPIGKPEWGYSESAENQ